MKEKRNTIYKKISLEYSIIIYLQLKKIDLNNPRDRLVFVF